MIFLTLLTPIPSQKCVFFKGGSKQKQLVPLFNDVRSFFYGMKKHTHSNIILRTGSQERGVLMRTPLIIVYMVLFVSGVPLDIAGILLKLFQAH